MGTIVVDNLGKKYKQYSNRWLRLVEWMGKRQLHQEHWVLRGVSFSVKKGESIGIIGQNGAGKSTLLKMLTATTKPSEGEIRLEGRVSALLELGMGFHPDFTGRHNVVMTGQLMGLNNEKIAKLMPEIEAFAEIGEYINQPLRTYSSGMAVRLAFAAATAVRPDILIVDEALSVGDAYFQHKCFDRIRRFKEQGTTLLFVSHDPGAVKNLCDRAILLDRGLMIKDGKPEEILDYYNAVIAKREADYNIRQSQGQGERIITRSGDGGAIIKEVKIYSNGKAVNAVQVGERIELRASIEFLKDLQNPSVGFVFKDRLGNEVYGTNTYHLGLDLGRCTAGKQKEVCFFLQANFGIGNYSITVAIHEGHSHISGNFDWWDHAETLQVISGNEKTFVGICYIETTAQVK